MKKELGGIKILVLGDSSSGKTSFFSSLSGEGKCLTTEPTYGCEVHIIEHNSKLYEFYELGGSNFDSEANRVLLQCHFAGYLLFFDVNNIKSLYNLANYRLDNLDGPIKIIGSKVDLIDVGSRAYQKVKHNFVKLSNKIHLSETYFIEASAFNLPEENLILLTPFMDSLLSHSSRKSEFIFSRDEVKDEFTKMEISGSSEPKPKQSMFSKLTSWIKGRRKNS